MKLKDVNNSVLETRELEILKLQVLVMGYHQIFQDLVETVIDNGIQEEFCGTCHFGTPCNHVDNPDENCIRIKLTDMGIHWGVWSKEEIKEQVEKSKNALFSHDEFFNQLE